MENTSLQNASSANVYESGERLESVPHNELLDRTKFAQRSNTCIAYLQAARSVFKEDLFYHNRNSGDDKAK